MEKICPCKDCVPPERKSGCHDICKKYIEWNQNHQKLKEAERKNKYYANL